MNLTLKKYELMKEAGIEMPIAWNYDHEYWGPNSFDLFLAFAEWEVAAILERVCREWLEKQSIFVYCFHGPDIDFATYAWKRVDDTVPEQPLFVTNEEFYKSFDAAQIAALEYCLKKGIKGSSTQESSNENNEKHGD